MKKVNIENVQFLVHWDHHPGPNETPHYGAGTRAQEIRNYIRAVRPDMMQYHALGGYGYASFTSEIAPPVPGLVGDPLSIWKAVCDEEDVPFGLYVAAYACGYPKKVPQWCEISKDGKPKADRYCYNGPWTEEFLIPLLLELMERYKPNHFWFDGVWLPDEPCYCKYCRKRFEETYGYPMPEEPTEEQGIEIKAMQETSMDDAFGRIARAVRTKDPDILLAGNSAYYFRDLRPPVGVDWLSWDYPNMPNWRKVSFQSVYLSTVGLPADMMVYENAIVCWSPMVQRLRPLTHLKTEAASILAHGVRFHLWHNPEPDGSIRPGTLETAASVATFVRERADWCIGAEPVANVAIIASSRLHLAKHSELEDRVCTIHDILKQGHIPCEVVRPDTFDARHDRYQVVIVPEARLIADETAKSLKAFAEAGGTVFVIGKPSNEIVSMFSVVSSKAGMDETGLEERPVGKGKILLYTRAALTDYLEAAHPAVRDELLDVLRKTLSGQEQVEVTAPTGVEVVITRKNGCLYVHFVNHVPGRIFHETRELFLDEVCVVHGIRARVRIESEPVRVALMPGEEAVEYVFDDGWLTVELPPLEHHQALQIEV